MDSVESMHYQHSLLLRVWSEPDETLQVSGSAAWRLAKWTDLFQRSGILHQPTQRPHRRVSSKTVLLFNAHAVTSGLLRAIQGSVRTPEKTTNAIVGMHRRETDRDSHTREARTCRIYDLHAANGLSDAFSCDNRSVQIGRRQGNDELLSTISRRDISRSKVVRHGPSNYT